MAAITWAPDARQDLKEILLYIKRNSRDYALYLKNLIFSRIRLLIQFPRMGGIVPERNSEDIREILIESYRIIYRISKNNLEIIGIIHSHQKFPIRL